MRYMLLSLVFTACGLMICPAARAQTTQPSKLPEATVVQSDQDNVRLEQLKKRAELRRAIESSTGLVDVTPDAVHKLIANLQEQREQLKLEIAGDEGRRKGLQQAIDNLSARLEKRVDSDEVVKELAKVVELRTAQLAKTKLMYQQASISAGEVDQAEEKVALARADLAAARQKAVGADGPESLEGWNHQLMELAVNSMDRQARLEYVERRLDELSRAQDKFDQLEQLQDETETPIRVFVRPQAQDYLRVYPDRGTQPTPPVETKK